MRNHLIILFLYLLSACYAAAQTMKTPIQVFYGHFQSCHIVGTTEEDIVMELFDDSTLKISTYRTNYIDQHSSVLRETFIGKYKSNNNTIEVKYIAQSVDCKSKPENRQTIFGIRPYLGIPNLAARWPSSVFHLQSNSVLSKDNSFPELKETTAAISSQLESKFDSWDRSKKYSE